MSSSSSSSSSSKGLDLWSVVESDTTVAEEGVDDPCVLVLGDSKSGKSSLLQGFLKPTVTKDPKPTVALDYNFARKKATAATATAAASGTDKGGASRGEGKTVSNIWELAGDCNDTKLLEIPINSKTLPNLSVVVCVDLSRPQNAIASTIKWIKAAKEVISRKLLELQSINASIASQLKEASRSQYRESPDSSKCSPCDVPIYIIGNKLDLFRSLPLNQRRACLQSLRFVAHYHGATFLTTAVTEASQRESIKSIMSLICFRISPVTYTSTTGSTSALAPVTFHPIRIACDTSFDRPNFVTAGLDRYESILTGVAMNKDGSKIEEPSSEGGKAKLVPSDSEIASFLKGSSFDSTWWGKLKEVSKTLFGASEVDEALPSADQLGLESETKSTSNEYPEVDIDTARESKYLALQRYIQEADRREATSAINSDVTDHTDNEVAGGGGGSSSSSSSSGTGGAGSSRHSKK